MKFGRKRNNFLHLESSDYDNSVIPGNKSTISKNPAQKSKKLPRIAAQDRQHTYITNNRRNSNLTTERGISQTRQNFRGRGKGRTMPRRNFPR